MSSDVIIAVSVGTACGLLLLACVIALLCRMCLKKKRGKHGEYEKIIPDVMSHKPRMSSHTIEPPAAKNMSNLVTPTISMKTIPFTVPAAGTPTSARRTGLEDGSTGSGSEPNSPLTSLGKSTSLDSASSTASELRGAYSLGSIDPSLYRMTDEDDDYDYPDDHVGRIWFAVEYERESEKLLVTVIKAKNLPSRVHGNINGCDPFVRIYLMPDERRYLQSKFKKKTCNPKFEESFVFQVSHKGIQERVLKFTVFDVDRHKRHNVVGHALYPLKEHDYESNERVVIWRDLEREISECTGSSDRGEVHIAMSYNNHLERLTVGVFEGKNFKKGEGGTTIDYYMKVCILVQNKLVKSKKTEVIKRCPNPNFNESFTFKLPLNSLDTASVTIQAMQHQSGQRDKSAGRVVLGSFMFARGKELEHWNEMVGNQREQVAYWHVLT